MVVMEGTAKALARAIAGPVLLFAIIAGLFAMHGIQPTPGPVRMPGVLNLHDGAAMTSDRDMRTGAHPRADVNPPARTDMPTSTDVPAGTGMPTTMDLSAGVGLLVGGVRAGAHGGQMPGHGGHGGGEVCLALLLAGLLVFFVSRVLGSGLSVRPALSGGGVPWAGPGILPRGPTLARLCVLRR
ncbi:hypothetical protein Ssi03_47690 [Sphaerisporangium siamense]|uniref:Uncharacterized protein n=1 Tax=Sphaerisporangium siamense TaxID=795645 RepID=A0A7W7D332_9ACTN|nr:hypothetical protein [Sphaerisporangium siamense]MBB4699094.1 hypothetical protein [Sphaerisporangium siamense]GII86779.1 hypothetical protein Ssi03_47690 [Sphaerisporangium siamense]